ncbi:hypothetical protein EMCRGX_G032982 [Ephydatia muelleri]
MDPSHPSMDLSRRLIDTSHRSHGRIIATVDGQKGIQIIDSIRRDDEKWGDFADQLRCLADKAFPTLEEDARELLAVDRYLSNITDPSIAFAVRQKRPETMEEAVAATLEMESYSTQCVKEKEKKVSFVEEATEHDVGAAVSLLRKDKWQLLGGADKYKLEQWTGSQLVGVEGSPVPVYGATCVKVQMGDLCVNIDFLVVDSLKVESLIGIDFLEKHRCVVNLEEGVLQLKGISIPLQNTRSSYKRQNGTCTIEPCGNSAVERGG